jgi:hypothetical protein
MRGDPLENWEYKHESGHNGAKDGYDPECPFCNRAVMAEIESSGI